MVLIRGTLLEVGPLADEGGELSASGVGVGGEGVAAGFRRLVVVVVSVDEGLDLRRRARGRSLPTWL